jgi:hypothetical protein
VRASGSLVCSWCRPGPLFTGGASTPGSTGRTSGIVKFFLAVDATAQASQNRRSIPWVDHDLFVWMVLVSTIRLQPSLDPVGLRLSDATTSRSIGGLSLFFGVGGCGATASSSDEGFWLVLAILSVDLDLSSCSLCCRCVLKAQKAMK